MIFNIKPIKYKLIEPLAKLAINEGFITDKRQREVTFLRYIGIAKDREAYVSSLFNLEKSLVTQNIAYIKVCNGFSKLTNVSKVNEMKGIMSVFLELDSGKHMDQMSLNHLSMGYCIPDEALEWTKKNAFKEIMTLYSKVHNNKYSKNLGVKLLYWMDEYLGQIFDDQSSLNNNRQIIYYGDIKNNEVYFLMLLTKIGIDVIYINPKRDIHDVLAEIDDYSHLMNQGHLTDEAIVYPEQKMTPKVTNNSALKQNEPSRREEKSFEELALYAESVVMIKVYNEKEEVIGGGSGVVINDKGNIITNCHVVSGGVGFGVLFENDDREYLCPSIIKYHTDYDLALIKVERCTKPFNLELKPMVRGQKIFSIGSPMGLFNTISEGIISGFRTFGQLDMVQITAPISPGSSGGALLDMYGNLVGITTAGIEGQNLNLTVPSGYIKEFANNFIR